MMPRPIASECSTATAYADAMSAWRRSIHGVGSNSDQWSDDERHWYDHQHAFDHSPMTYKSITQTSNNITSKESNMTDRYVNDAGVTIHQPVVQDYQNHSDFLTALADYYDDYAAQIRKDAEHENEREQQIKDDNQRRKDDRELALDTYRRVARDETGPAAVDAAYKLEASTRSY